MKNASPGSRSSFHPSSWRYGKVHRSFVFHLVQDNIGFLSFLALEHFSSRGKGSNEPSLKSRKIHVASGWVRKSPDWRNVCKQRIIERC